MSTRVIMINGFEEVGYLAKSLIEKGYKVSAINEMKEQCDILASIDGLQVFYGDGSKPYVLEDADVYGADIIIAMSPYDDANLVICQLCKKRFNVGKTVAMITDPNNTDFFKLMGVDSVVCATTVLSAVIEQQATLNAVKTIMPVGQGGVQVEQVEIPESSPVVNRRLWEIDIPEDVVIGCIMRGNKSIIPSGETRIYSGDNLLLIVAEDCRETVIRRLVGK